jgi:hypothetical protein
MKMHKQFKSDVVMPSQGTDFEKTAALSNVTAKDLNATGKNQMKEHVVKHGPFGKLGGRGRGE